MTGEKLGDLLVGHPGAVADGDLAEVRLEQMERGGLGLGLSLQAGFHVAEGGEEPPLPGQRLGAGETHRDDGEAVVGQVVDRALALGRPEAALKIAEAILGGLELKASVG